MRGLLLAALALAVVGCAPPAAPPAAPSADAAQIELERRFVAAYHARTATCPPSVDASAVLCRGAAFLATQDELAPVESELYAARRQGGRP